MGLKIILGGYSGVGKDEVSRILSEEYGFSFGNATKTIIEEAKKIVPILQPFSVDYIYENRDKYRDVLFGAVRHICEEENDDSYLLMRHFEEYDIWSGVREKKELFKCLERCMDSGIEVLTIWVDASERVPRKEEEPDSIFTVTKDMFAYHLDNNGTKEELEKQIDELMRVVGRKRIRGNGLAYTREKIDYVQNLLETKVTVHPTTASRIMCRDFGIEYNEEIGRWYRRLFRQDKLLENSVTYKEALKREIKPSRNYLITSAQNSTPVHEGLVSNMEAYMEYFRATSSCELVVVASRYRNPTLYDEGLKKNYWDERVSDYLVASRQPITGTSLVVGADIRVPYTTILPINNVRALAKDFSLIVGHPKQDYESLIGLDTDIERDIYTTGSCTLPNNYSDTMSGKKAENNHKMGFIHVMVQSDGSYSVINVEADEYGNFLTPYLEVRDGEVIKNPHTIDTVVVGDIHAGFHDKEVLEEVYAFCADVLPKNVVLHDVLSAETVHRYNIKDVYKAYQLLKGGWTIEGELDMAMEVIEDFKRVAEESVIIPASNHHFILENWIKNYRIGDSLVNAGIYAELSNLLINGNVGEEGLFAHLVRKRFGEGKSVITPSYSKGHKTLGVEVGQHGDKGANGARGGIASYTDKVGSPIIFGHGHSPTKRGDTLMVGTTSKKQMGYNQGYSSWRNTFLGLVYKNGRIGYLKY